MKEIRGEVVEVRFALCAADAPRYTPPETPATCQDMATARCVMQGPIALLYITSD